MKRVAAMAWALILAVSMAGCDHQQAQRYSPASERLEGHFEDVYRWDGAVVGTRYEEASEEIEIRANKASDNILVELTMCDPGKFPYRGITLYGLENYKIVDEKNSVIIDGATTELGAYSDGKASLQIPLDALKGGNYKLLISEIVATDSAEDPNPLIIAGEWACEFTW